MINNKYQNLNHKQFILKADGLLVGGVEKDGGARKFIFSLRSDLERWTDKGELFKPRKNPGCVWKDSKLYIFGGVGSHQIVETAQVGAGPLEDDVLPRTHNLDGGSGNEYLHPYKIGDTWYLINRYGAVYKLHNEAWKQVKDKVAGLDRTHKVLLIKESEVFGYN